MDERLMIKRVLLISNVPQPYRIPLFNELDKQCKEKNIELKIVFASRGYKRRKFILDFSEMKFNYEILKSFKIHFGNIEKTFFTYSGISKIISQYQPDKIIVSGFSLATIKIWIRSFFQKTEYIIWSGAWEFPGRLDSWGRKFQRRLLIRRAFAFVSYGSKAKEYLIKMGASEEKVFIAINTVDTNFFSGETKKIRSALTKVGKKHLIYIGYLVPRKNVSKLIEIIHELSKTRNDFVLDILGDGNEKDALEKVVEEKKLNDVIKFHGFIQKQDLPKYLAISCCFLFQTDFDVWGLVVNEAMAAGVPVMSSINAAATFDLIEDGETGFATDYNNKSDVLQKINTIIDNDSLVESLEKNAADFIEKNASVQMSASGFLKSILS
ncbi:MAG: glycosyltransferase family 4 protein [Bacteroidota bacterium]